jgi:hypothetical protein
MLCAAARNELVGQTYGNSRCLLHEVSGEQPRAALFIALKHRNRLCKRWHNSVASSTHRHVNLGRLFVPVL